MTAFHSRAAQYRCLLPVIVTLLSALFAGSTVRAQGDFTLTGETVKMKAAEILKVGDNLFVAEDEGARYVLRNLPGEFKQAGLRIALKGQVLNPPVHVRMAGTPVHLTRVKAGKNHKEYSLGQRKYKFEGFAAGTKEEES